MINTDDKLLCIKGNAFYAAGDVYIVGEFINDKFFKLLTGCNDEHWYANEERQGVKVCFHADQSTVNDAWFDKLA